MPLARTNEPTVMIESDCAGPPRRLVYRDLVTGERWAEVGECNRCGLCEIGGAREADLVWDATKRRGEPGSCLDPAYDDRPEIVNRPTMKDAMRRMAESLGVAGGCSYDFEVL